MKTYKKQLRNKVFLALDDNLIEVELVNETLTFNTASYEYVHNEKLGGIEVSLEGTPFTNLFYKSVEDYHNMNPIKCDIADFSFGREEVGNTEDKLVVPAYVFEDNRAVKKDVKVLSVFSINPYSYEVNIDKSVRAYTSAAECLAYNKVKATNIAGEDMPTDTGYMVDLLTFSAEQKKAIENLRKAIEKVNETCTFVCGDKGLSVINGKHSISDMDWADCNGEWYRELYESGISLPAIRKNHEYSPVLLK